MNGYSFIQKYFELNCFKIFSFMIIIYFSICLKVLLFHQFRLLRCSRLGLDIIKTSLPATTFQPLIYFLFKRIKFKHKGLIFKSTMSMIDFGSVCIYLSYGLSTNYLIFFILLFDFFAFISFLTFGNCTSIAMTLDNLFIYDSGFIFA